MARKNSQADKAEQATSAAGATKARVLVVCEHGRPNDVVELDAATLSAAVAADQVDPHPDAVAYALSLKN